MSAAALHQFARQPVAALPSASDAPTAAEQRCITVADHAAKLYAAALAGTLALSDRTGVLLLLAEDGAPRPVAECWAAQRLATDLLQRRARSTAGLIAAGEAARALAEDVAEGATAADLHAVLEQISGLLGDALALTSD